jgi:phosphoglycolate phosphatase
MKPNPYIITTALRLVSAEPDDAVLIGDTITDVHVAKTTGVRSIGYAKTTTRGAEFTAAGADAITEQISTLAAAINGPTTAPPH